MNVSHAVPLPLFSIQDNNSNNSTPTSPRSPSSDSSTHQPSSTGNRSFFIQKLRNILPNWSQAYLPLQPSNEQSAATTMSPPREVPLGICDTSHGVLRRGRWYRKKHKAPTVDGASGDNAVCNRKYNIFSFVPLVLYDQFRMFYNLFFLLVALSQLVPALRVGFMVTYFGPLTFVILVSTLKEAFDDFARYQRDTNLNQLPYTVLLNHKPSSSSNQVRPQRRYRFHAASGNEDEEEGFGRSILDMSDDGNCEVLSVKVASQDLRVGDIIVLETNERVPADCVLLHATPSTKSNDTDNDNEHEITDTLFIRTDQLDGETDWKLRRAVATTQAIKREDDLLHSRFSKCIIEAEAPKREIYDFVGTFIDFSSDFREPLTLENTLWANTVVASGRAVCVIIYNGDETRSRMNASNPKSKVGKLDHEVNRVSKMLFMLLFSLSALLTGLRGFTGQWILYFCRYFLLLSSIIPISMRVNLDMAKIAYSMFIESDKEKLKGCTVRNSNLPEELGRIEYLMSDKTGTLTQNEMAFKKLHLGSMLFGRDALDDIHQYAKAAFQHDASVKDMMVAPSLSSSAPSSPQQSSSSPSYQSNYRQQLSSSHRQNSSSSRRAQNQVQEALLSIALAHKVTPIEENGQHSLQAASPDEVALLKFAESVGFYLKARSMSRIIIIVPGGYEMKFDILAEFPFTSEAKRMGIIVQDKQSKIITLYVKGADTIMAKKVRYNDWLEEECGNLAREGLRTLVFAKRELSENEYETFLDKWYTARTSSLNRKENMLAVQSDIEKDMKLLALTGVEDKLQNNVRETLEKLRHAGIRIWMLTGDKVETATCIAISSRLAERSQGIFKITGISSKNEASRVLNRFKRHSRTDVLVLDGQSLQIFLDLFPEEFIEIASMAPAAVACRCSPTQKAAVVKLLQTHMGKRVAAIGDGGNDVGMIQEAHVGIGIPGKEGMQASMASDFSITSFSHLSRLLLWHGRNSYKRSARLAQFVIHRGLIISIIQTVYCALFFYATVSVYSGWILVGYATVFTMFPVFSLILDEDVNESAADTYPELYKDLQKGRSLNLKTFLIWVFKSIYQGTMIMVFSVYVIWDNEYFTTLHLSAISFTSLVLTELLMVAFEVHTWHWMMIIAEICSILFYIASVFILEDTFDHSLIFQWGFLGRVLVVTLVSCLPVTVGKWLKRKYAPAPYSKLA